MPVYHPSVLAASPSLIRRSAKKNRAVVVDDSQRLREAQVKSALGILIVTLLGRFADSALLSSRQVSARITNRSSIVQLSSRMERKHATMLIIGNATSNAATTCAAPQLWDVAARRLWHLSADRCRRRTTGDSALHQPFHTSSGRQQTVSIGLHSARCGAGCHLSVDGNHAATPGASLTFHLVRRRTGERCGHMPGAVHDHRTLRANGAARYRAFRSQSRRPSGHYPPEWVKFCAMIH
mgnify:CR=1 FL=1